MGTQVLVTGSTTSMGTFTVSGAATGSVTTIDATTRLITLTSSAGGGHEDDGAREPHGHAVRRHLTGSP